MTLVLMASCLTAATVRRVGPKQKYRTPCQAIAAARAGDTIEIDAAGKYDGDVCAFTQNNVTLRGVNGRARLEAAGAIAKDKAIWVIGGDGVVVEDIEFSGAKATGKNGAGIRAEGGALTIRNCYFHDNEDGILTNHNPEARIVIEYSEFARNGYGDGYSHNMYIGSIAEFTLRYSWSHDAIGGHLVKSRAAVNRILYNRLSTETTNSSYELDLPNGGDALVMGNVIAQGETAENIGMMTYQVEKTETKRAGRLKVIHNTFVNMKQARTTFIALGEGVMEPPLIRDNVFSGAGSITNAVGGTLQGNVVAGADQFENAARWDFRPRAGAAAIDAGAALPAEPAPVMQYAHPACVEGRKPAGRPDVGAFEPGGGTPPGDEVKLPGRCR